MQIVVSVRKTDPTLHAVTPYLRNPLCPSPRLVKLSEIPQPSLAPSLARPSPCSKLLVSITRNRLVGTAILRDGHRTSLRSLQLRSGMTRNLDKHGMIQNVLDSPMMQRDQGRMSDLQLLVPILSNCTKLSPCKSDSTSLTLC